MASKRKFPGTAAVILLSVALMLAVTACPTDSDGGGGGGARTVLEGTWEGPGSQQVTFSGNSFTRITGSTLDLRGTFTLSSDGETIDFAINRWSTDGGRNWLNRAQYIDARIIATIGQSSWDAMTAAQKQQARDTYLSYGLISEPPKTDSGEYELFLDGMQLKIIYAGTGNASSGTVLYQKAGTSTVSTALVGKWVLESAPTVTVLDFSTSQLQLQRSSTLYTYYTLETDGRIEIGTDLGTFTQDFCTSYTITGNRLTFTGGSSADWYPNAEFVKYEFPPFPATALTANQWADGVITTQASEAWYSFPVTNGTTYRLWWNDGYSSGGNGTKTLDVKVSGYYDANTAIFTDADTAWGTARSFTANKSGTVYIKVIPYSSGGTGTFGIVYSTGTTRPDVAFNPPSNATPLTANVWTDGEITGSETEVWHSFPVTSGNPFYVWWNESGGNTYGNRIKTLNINVSAYYANGTSVFSNAAYAWDTPRSFTPTLDSTVYLRVTPATSGSTGTYGIVYNTTNTRPAVSVAPASAIALTENQWANGAITAQASEAWYSFSVTSGTTYRLWGNGSGDGLFKTLQGMRVSAWYNNGNNAFYDSSNTWSFAASFTAASTGTVYVRVYSSTSGNTGTFGLIYSSTATARPAVPFDPNEAPDVVTLTAGQWANGNIPTSGGQQWFKLTATASTQYIHVILGTLSGFYVQVYDSNSDSVGSETNFSTSSPRFSNRTLTVGQDYYIRVRAYSGSGGYQILFNTAIFPPVDLPSSATTLTVAQWTNGNIASGGEQWFRFTATATTQYIHVSFGTLNNMDAQLYDSSGDAVGSAGALYGSYRSMERTVVIGQEYYLKVYPYSNLTGTYQIAFNASSTAPPQ